MSIDLELLKYSPISLKLPWWIKRKDDLQKFETKKQNIIAIDEETLNERAFNALNLGDISDVFVYVSCSSNIKIMKKLHKIGVGFITQNEAELNFINQILPKLDSQKLLQSSQFEQKNNILNFDMAEECESNVVGNFEKLSQILEENQTINKLLILNCNSIFSSDFELAIEDLAIDFPNVQINLEASNEILDPCGVFMTSIQKVTKNSNTLELFIDVDPEILEKIDCNSVTCFNKNNEQQATKIINLANESTVFNGFLPQIDAEQVLLFPNSGTAFNGLYKKDTHKKQTRIQYLNARAICKVR